MPSSAFRKNISRLSQIGVDPTVVSPAAISQVEAPLSLINIYLHENLSARAWCQRHTESVLFGRQLPRDRLVILECRLSFRLSPGVAANTAVYTAPFQKIVDMKIILWSLGEQP
jgi:hypothetical protein